MFSGLVLLLVGVAAAQNCTPDLLLDDFSSVQTDYIEGAQRNIGKQGGDYGGEHVYMDFSQVEDHGYLAVTATKSQNHFFFKIDKEACYDISKYKALRIVFSAAPGANSKFTLTQKSSDCSERIEGGDSTYKNLQDYTVPTGEVQKIEMPLHHYSGRADPGRVPPPFDMHHLKDFTFVDMEEGVQFKFFRLEMVGDCPPGHVPPSTTSKAPQVTVSTTTTPSSTTSSVSEPSATVSVTTKVPAANQSTEPQSVPSGASTFSATLLSLLSVAMLF